MYTISGAKKWSETLDLFSHAVNDGKFHKLNYDTFRKLAKYHPVGDVINILRKDDGIITVVDPKTESGYLLWSGSEIDNSFGSFLYDKYFKENEKMNPNETNAAQYDLWGNYTSCNSFDVAQLASCNCTAGSLATNALEINGIDWNSSGATNMSVSSYCSYPTPEEFKMLQKRVEELGKLCTDLEVDVHITRETLCSEVNQVIDEVSAVDDRKAEVGEVSNLYRNLDEVRKYADAVSYDVERALRDIDDNAADIHAMGDEIWNLRQMVEELHKKFENEKVGVRIVPIDDRKDKENMDTNKIFNFDFGPVASHIRMSPYGMAMKNADGKYVSYDKNSGNIMDVEIFNFDAQKFLYKMPVAVSAVAVGDIVVHMRKAMFVSAVNGNRISVIDIYNGEVKDIMPTTSPFGFNFITKVVSLIDMSGANTDSPFGNMLPLLMMGEGKDFKDILPLMLMTGGNANFAQNPLMLYALMGDGNMNDILPFMFMMGNNPFAPAPAVAPANCHCGHHENHNQCNGDCHC